MSDSKKYYYLKVKETFFDSEEMKVMESMKNGIEYQNLYLKMCLLSVKAEGKLMFKDVLPYDFDMLSTVLRVSIDTVKTAVGIFNQMGLVDILDNGSIYMSDIQSLIGRSSSEGERKKGYRERIKAEKVQIGTNNGTLSGRLSLICPGHRTPEIELDKETETEIKKESDFSGVPDFEDDIADAFNDTPEPPKRSLPEQSLSLANLLFTLHRDNFDASYKVSPANIEKWAADIEKLNRIDKRTWEEIETIIRWVKSPGQFWAPNIMSGSKLREKFPALLVQSKQTKTQNGKPLKVQERTTFLDMED